MPAENDGKRTIWIAIIAAAATVMAASITASLNYLAATRARSQSDSSKTEATTISKPPSSPVPAKAPANVSASPLHEALAAPPEPGAPINKQKSSSSVPTPVTRPSAFTPPAEMHTVTIFHSRHLPEDALMVDGKQAAAFIVSSTYNSTTLRLQSGSHQLGAGTCSKHFVVPAVTRVVFECDAFFEGQPNEK